MTDQDPFAGEHTECAHEINRLLNENRRLRAALAAEPVETGWLPIESAPKDGTYVLAWREDCGPFIASYTSASEFPLTQKEIDAMDEASLFDSDWFTQWPHVRCDGSEAPTHWMHLPDAPKGTT